MFSSSAKVALVRPVFKKNGRTDIQNYRLASIFNFFSEVYEKFLNKKIQCYAKNVLSEFISVYRSGYSTNHVLNLTN